MIRGNLTFSEVVGKNIYFQGCFTWLWVFQDNLIFHGAKSEMMFDAEVLLCC